MRRISACHCGRSVTGGSVAGTTTASPRMNETGSEPTLSTTAPPSRHTSTCTELSPAAAISVSGSSIL